jgi:F-type H+-transporting ATPase subunit c
MNFRKALFFILSMVFTFGASVAMAAEGAPDHSGIGGLGAALAIGIAAFGGGLGQGRTAAAALEGIARNPAAQGKIFVPMIICLALIESLVIYALIIAYVKY